MQEFLGAAVVNDPEYAGFALRARQSAGFANLRVFKASCNLKCQRCRLLRIGAAGKQQ
jgi:hypothetical protein